MPNPTSLSAEDRELVRRYEDAGQGHVFRFLRDLPAAEAESLVADARAVDPAQIARLLAQKEAPLRGVLEPPGDELEPLEHSDDFRRLRNAAHDRGLNEISERRVAVVVAAGGQGTRLGGTTPKALWPVGPLSGKPLLQWHAEKVLHWSRQVRQPVPFLLLVSDATARATEEFLRWHGHFGLDPTWVRLARQRSLPAVDEDGKILLASRSRIALAPNGHGGLFAALQDAKLLDLLADHGVRTISYAQVDNPLVRTLDPVFVGFHARRESKFSSKSVRKRSPSERVGVFGRRDGRPCLIEYTELPAELASATDEDGSLRFGHGSIAAHCIDLGFARRAAAAELPYHRAHKKVTHVDASGKTVEPAAPNAWKFESFLFDAIPMAERTLVLETLRSDEFSPIKNADGEDSPESARRDLVAMFRAWQRRANLPADAETLEVSPLEAPDEHAFRRVRGLPWQ